MADTNFIGSDGSIPNKVFQNILYDNDTQNINHGTNNTFTNTTLSTVFSGIDCSISDSVNSLIYGSNNSHIVNGEGSFVIGGAGNDVNSYWSGAIAAQGSTIGPNAHHSVILAAQGVTVTGDHSFSTGISNSVSGNKSIGLGSSVTLSGNGSFVFNDTSLTTTSFTTNNAMGFYVTNGGVISDSAGILPSVSSVLRVHSTTKAGLLIDPITPAQKSSITPVQGAIIYDNVNGPQYGDGSAWQNFSYAAPSTWTAFSATITSNMFTGVNRTSTWYYLVKDGLVYLRIPNYTFPPIFTPGGYPIFTSPGNAFPIAIRPVGGTATSRMPFYIEGEPREMLFSIDTAGIVTISELQQYDAATNRDLQYYEAFVARNSGGTMGFINCVLIYDKNPTT